MCIHRRSRWPPCCAPRALHAARRPNRVLCPHDQAFREPPRLLHPRLLLSSSLKRVLLTARWQILRIRKRTRTLILRPVSRRLTAMLQQSPLRTWTRITPINGPLTSWIHCSKDLSSWSQNTAPRRSRGSTHEELHAKQLPCSTRMQRLLRRPDNLLHQRECEPGEFVSPPSRVSHQPPLLRVSMRSLPRLSNLQPLVQLYPWLCLSPPVRPPLYCGRFLRPLIPPSCLAATTLLATTSTSATGPT